MRILIVDDSPDDRLLLKTVLTKAGYEELLFAESAREAFELLGIGRPGVRPPPLNLILTDVMMPEIDGIEACQRFKSDPEVASIPVIMVTGKTGAKDLRAAFSAGAMDYITKPINKVELVARVNSALAIQKAQQELRASERRMRDIAAALGEGLFVLDANGAITFVNPEAEQLLGWSEAELIGRDAHETLHFCTQDGSHYPRGDCPILAAVLRGETYRSENEHFIAKEGRAFPVQLVAAPLTEEGTVVGSVVAFQDITQRREAESNLRLAAKVIETSLEGIVVTGPDSIIQSVNPAFTTFTGYRPDEVIGEKPNMLRSGRQDEEFYQRMWEALRREGQWQGEIWNRHKSGDIYPEWLSISAIKDEQGEITQYVGIFSDISALKLAEQRLEHLATHDMLTGLPNRMLLMDRLAQALAQSKRQRDDLALLFIDLDKFKPINDTYGHEAGDLVLQEVAWRLTSCVRESDTVARMGGDEFVVVLQGVGGEDAAAAVAEKILLHLQLPVKVAEGVERNIGGSIGIAIHHHADRLEDADALISHADVAMYHVKESGRNHYEFYHRLAPEDRVVGR